MSDDKGIKIAPEYRNPIDSGLYIIIRAINPTFWKLGITPNMITTLSLVFSLAGVWLFYKQKMLPLAAILFFIGYLFDCQDGYMARKYKMVSKFGDYYDHISDVLKYIALLVAMFLLRKNNTHFLKYLSFIAFLTVLVVIDLGCEERIYNKNEESDTLKLTQKLCYDKSMIKWARFFGPGTLMMILGVIMLVYRK